MSEYLVKRQSLENIADEIRVLAGTTELLGLTEMATNINDANDEVADQTDLIAQLASALQGKSVPGGGEDVTAETETYTDLLTDLEAAVDTLPDAGSGAPVKKTVTITVEATLAIGTITYFDESGTLCSMHSGTYTIEALGGALVMPPYTDVNIIQGSAVYEGARMSKTLVVCREDGTTIKALEHQSSAN
jgi:hypothetical protein